MASSDGKRKKRAENAYRRIIDLLSRNKKSINDLPDSILLEILYRLPLTKDAAKTSVLSKRWRSLWTHLRRLSFSFSYDTLPSVSSLAICLIQHASPKVTHLEILVDTALPPYCPLDPSEFFESHVDVLLAFARRKGVDVFSLDYTVNRCAEDYCDDDSVPYVFRRGFYPCSSTREFKTSGCDLKDVGRVEWPLLRVLDVSLSNLSNDVTLGDVLSGCPMLESLRLYCCKFECLDVTSTSLKKLVIKDIVNDFDEEPEIRVSAPCLEHLELVSHMCSNTHYTLIDVRSLAVVNIDLHDDFWCDEDDSTKQKAIVELLEKVRYVKELRVNTWYIRALLAWSMEANVLPALSCKCLILRLCGNDGFACPGLKRLLQSSSMVEKLVLDFKDYGSGGTDFEDFINSIADWKSPCTFTSFRHYVKIIHVHGLCDSHENFYILEFLLKHATVLEEMVVRDIKSRGALDKLIFSKKLLDLPRASPVAVVRLPDDVDKNMLASL